jgi:hypothetical protein
MLMMQMAFEKLSTKEQEIVLRCMRATVAHVADSEKHARLGLQPEELQRVIAELPDIDDADEDGNGFLAVNNCMNEVCHGFRIAPEDWPTWFDTPKGDIEAVYQKWLALTAHSGGIR